MKKSLTERDICTKFITPALEQAGGIFHRQIREEVTFTAGRVIVRGKLDTRGRRSAPTTSSTTSPTSPSP